MMMLNLAQSKLVADAKQQKNKGKRNLIFMRVENIIDYFTCVTQCSRIHNIMETGKSGILTQRTILAEEIQATRSRVAKMKEIESELNVVSGLVKNQQQKSRKSLRDSREGLKERGVTQPTNSNRKIKIYELQKKLDARNREHKEKHVVYVRKLSQLEGLLEQISQLDDGIRQENIQGDELLRLMAEMASNVKLIQGKCEQMQKLARQEKSVLTIYEEEKINKINNIKKLKKILNLGSEKTEPDDESLAMSSEEQQNRGIEMVNRNRMVQKSELQRHGFSKEERLVTTLNAEKWSSSKELKNMSIEQIEQYVQRIQKEGSKYKEKQQKLISNLGFLKKLNKNLQASAKHTRTTRTLAVNQLTQLEKSTRQAEREILNSIEMGSGYAAKVAKKEGQRGDLRGRVGVKVQNNRLLGLINEEIETDYYIVREESAGLRLLFSEARERVGSLIPQVNSQSAISESVSACEK